MKRIFLLFFTAASLPVYFSGCAKSEMSDAEIPVIPVTLVGIEAVNVNNSGEFPFVTPDPVKKEAYMIGIVWETDDSDPDGNQSITPPIRGGSAAGRSEGLSDNYTKRIYCVTPFNSRNPAGSNVSQYFKKVAYCPAGVNEGFVLLVSPDRGVHSFRVVYTGNGKTFEYITQPIELQ